MGGSTPSVASVVIFHSLAFHVQKGLRRLQQPHALSRWSQRLHTIGRLVAAWACMAVTRMGFIQNADSAKSGPSRRCLVQSTQRHPRTSAIGLSVVPRICPTSGTRLARWACWVVGQMAFTQLAAFAALVFTAKSLAPMG